MMRGTRVLTVAGLIAFLLVVLVPFWWIASMSFKTYEQIQFAVSIYVPKPFTWENYTALWGTRFPQWLRNSVVTAVVVTAITTVIATLSGTPAIGTAGSYAFAITARTGWGRRPRRISR